jgi:hypothetical protein
VLLSLGFAAAGAQAYAGGTAAQGATAAKVQTSLSPAATVSTGRSTTLLASEEMRDIVSHDGEPKSWVLLLAGAFLIVSVLQRRSVIR